MKKTDNPNYGWLPDRPDRRNWGRSWGMGGYFTMPFGYLERLAGDFWTARR